MDDLRQRDPEFTTESTLHDLNPPQDQVTGAFFPNAQNFVVTGGRFKSITNIYHAAALAEPPDFPTIPMGYLNLLRELRLNTDTGAVSHHQSPVRRVHSARIHGSESTVTVAIYEGEKAEENWREAISQYSNLRHPNIIQLFGTSRNPKIHAAIFHDELIPARQMAEKYDIRPICTVYFRYYLASRSLAARHYVKSVSGNHPSEGHCTLWIRASTGGLCLDLTPDDFDFADTLSPREARHLATGDHLLEPTQDSDIIADMSLQHYHRTCSRYLSTPRGFFISTYTSLKLGTVYQNLRPNYESLVEVAFVSDLDFTDLGWENPNGTVPGQIMEDGWTRIPSAEVDHKYSCSIYAGDVAEWLSQANHIFKCLNITSNYEQYAVVDYVGYRLTFSGPNGLPPGYLFLCPLKYFHSHDPTCFPYPDFPAYWSLDPTGIERLSTEEATDLGFPSFEFKMMVIGFSWDSSAYDGLRAFHEAKGFDPYSQDVARHLGYPLYELSGVEGSFAHLEEISSEADYDELIHSEIPTVQDISSTETIQSQTTQFADFPAHLGLDVDLPADRSYGTSSNYLWVDTAVDSLSIPSSSTFYVSPLPPPQQTYLPGHSASYYYPSNLPPTPPEHLDVIYPLNIPTTDFKARTVSKRAEHWYNTNLYSVPSILPSGSSKFPDAMAPLELTSCDFAPYPTHLGLEVDFPADRSVGIASDYLWVDTAFDSFSIPSSSTTFSFSPPYPAHTAYLPNTSPTIQNASAPYYHTFNTPPTPPEQLNADPQNIPTSDLIARTARKRKAESQITERANKNMRLDLSWEAADFEELG